jgi:hypothetical protein
VFIPTLCPACTAIVVVPARGVLDIAGSRLYRCPSCRSIVWHAIDDDPPSATVSHEPTVAETTPPTEPPAPPADRP